MLSHHTTLLFIKNLTSNKQHHLVIKLLLFTISKQKEVNKNGLKIKTCVQAGH